MSDEEQNADHMVWGILVPRHASGRYRWPDAIKAKAVERILGGDKGVAIAMEIGANQSLVAKWVSDHKRSIGTTEGPGSFVEIIALDGVGPEAMSGSSAASCDIHLGDVRLTVRPGYPTS